MRHPQAHKLAVSGGAKKPNYDRGPGNSGPGDKNSQNERGHGGQPIG
jgi:hypothetical protein